MRKLAKVSARVSRVSDSLLPMLLVTSVLVAVVFCLVLSLVPLLLLS